MLLIDEDIIWCRIQYYTHLKSGKYIFNLEGVITRLSFQKSGTDPVTWNATLEFQIGDVIDSGE